MKNDITTEQRTAILQQLDAAIKNPHWGKSNFLKTIAKNLQQMRDDFMHDINNIDKKKIDEINAKLAIHLSIINNQQEIFISLYTTSGDCLAAWERILSNLSSYIISRPIYPHEEDVQFLIKSKENKINEGYVAIFVNKNDILHLAPDKILMDKFQKPLMTLKNKAIQLNNITRFVHLSGTYKFLKNRLIKN